MEHPIDLTETVRRRQRDCKEREAFLNLLAWIGAGVFISLGLFVIGTLWANTTHKNKIVFLIGAGMVTAAAWGIWGLNRIINRKS